MNVPSWTRNPFLHLLSLSVDYCNVCYMGLALKNIQNLQLHQNKVALVYLPNTFAGQGALVYSKLLGKRRAMVVQWFCSNAG